MARESTRGLLSLMERPINCSTQLAKSSHSSAPGQLRLVKARLDIFYLRSTPSQTHSIRVEELIIKSLSYVVSVSIVRILFIVAIVLTGDNGGGWPCKHRKSEERTDTGQR